MDLKSTITIILKDLEDARNILDDLKKYQDVPAFQIELAKAKCRSAEDVIRVLGEMNFEQGEISKPIEKIQEPEEIELLRSKPEENLIVDAPNLQIIEEDIEEVVITESLLDEIVEAPANDWQTEEKKGNKSQILADTFKKNSSINEQIAHKRHDDENSEISKMKPLKNLTEAIGINEKFMFIRELFNGNPDLYKQTLEELNISNNIDSAFTLLSESAPGTSGTEAFDQLLDLVKRKLSSS